MIKRRLGYTAVAFAMVFVMAQAGGWAAPDTPPRSDLVVGSDAGQATLSLGGADPFHRTNGDVTNARLIDVPGTATRLAIWEETEVSQGTSQAVPYYAISLDGQTMATVRRTSYELKLRHGDFDPALRAPQVNSMLTAGAETNIYIVQFVTQPLEEFRVAIRELGGTVHHFLANHAHIVEMSASVARRGRGAAVRALGGAVSSGVSAGGDPPRRVGVQRGGRMKRRVSIFRRSGEPRHRRWCWLTVFVASAVRSRRLRAIVLWSMPA